MSRCVGGWWVRNVQGVVRKECARHLLLMEPARWLRHLAVPAATVFG